jgi:hypothetical protein
MSGNGGLCEESCIFLFSVGAYVRIGMHLHQSILRKVCFSPLKANLGSAVNWFSDPSPFLRCVLCRSVLCGHDTPTSLAGLWFLEETQLRQKPRSKSWISCSDCTSFSHFSLTLTCVLPFSRPPPFPPLLHSLVCGLYLWLRKTVLLFST